MLDGVTALQAGDIDLFRRQLTAFLADIPYTMRRKENERERERYFHYTFYLLLRLLSNYVVYTEKQQSEGRVDCIIETDRYIYIFEFKLDGTAAGSDGSRYRAFRCQLLLQPAFVGQHGKGFWG